MAALAGINYKMNFENKRLLIISNMVISQTTNNGKTILSYFDSLPKDKVYQLYFSGEEPTEKEYHYFRISDMDIVRGKFNSQKRGAIIEVKAELPLEGWYSASRHDYSDFFRLVREVLWHKSWESKKLWEWLDEYDPTHIFFVGGDSCFAYDIAVQIRERYNSKLALYITDDYLMERMHEGFFSKIRRRMIRSKFKKCLDVTDVFFTISDVMARDYKKEFGRESFKIVNMPESLKIKGVVPRKDIITLMYAGNLYYGRDHVLGLLSDAIERINAENTNVKVQLNIYSNSKLTKEIRQRLLAGHSMEYGGMLNAIQLKLKLNEANILVFVESSLIEYVEKTKYSLSTKIPEYLSLSKPILAIGPKEIGSMEYLANVAMCVNNEDDIYSELKRLLDSTTLQYELANKAEKKFMTYNDKNKFQDQVLNYIFS